MRLTTPVRRLPPMGDRLCRLPVATLVIAPACQVAFAVALVLQHTSNPVCSVATDTALDRAASSLASWAVPAASAVLLVTAGSLLVASARRQGRRPEPFPVMLALTLIGLAALAPLAEHAVLDWMMIAAFMVLLPIGALLTAGDDLVIWGAMALLVAGIAWLALRVIRPLRVDYYSVVLIVAALVVLPVLGASATPGCWGP